MKMKISKKRRRRAYLMAACSLIELNETGYCEVYKKVKVDIYHDCPCGCLLFEKIFKLFKIRDEFPNIFPEYWLFCPETTALNQRFFSEESDTEENNQRATALLFAHEISKSK